MLVHDVVPEDFRVSILIPIPKGPRVDARYSDNYRAVALILEYYGKNPFHKAQTLLNMKTLVFWD